MYRQQLRRLERKYRALSKSRDAIEDSNIDEIRDLLLSFFQDCWHMRDWLINSTSLDQAQLNSFLSHSVEMNMCREICNTAKHLVLTRPTRVQHARLVDFRNIEVPLALAREYDPNGDKLTFIFLQQEYDAFELAGRYLDLWHEFLSSIA
ncbi:MAG TPA: hypothetical protein VEP90_00050 [Methylomirabilota bacterium]|nr:hypothetical protein [Methylomirabilota bacterium]